MYNEDGSLENLRLSFTGSDGIERDEYGNEIDSVQPTADTILKLMDGPELMHKGNGLCGLALSVSAFSMGFLFCLQMSCFVGIFLSRFAMQNMRSRLKCKLQEDIPAGRF